MFLASFLIGLREGLEAALIVGILVAVTQRRRRPEALNKITWGVGSAIGLSILLGAVFTFTAYSLSETGEQIFAGIMSLAAVGMITWMIFWMITAGRHLRSHLESEAKTALALGTSWAMFWIAFISVGREGLETTIMLWSSLTQPEALFGAVVGLLAAVALGYLVYRGLVRVNLGTFFTVTGIVLVIAAAGIAAHGIHELQEAAFLPGPYSGPPIAPTDLITGAVAVGLTGGPFWLASFPFGWAFDLTATIDPSTWGAALVKALLGVTPRMSWLEVIAWLGYLGFVLPKFLSRTPRRRSGAPEVDKPAPAEKADLESAVRE